MITKKDLDGAIENMIRRVSQVIAKAFENIATKNDLKIFATKDDLKIDILHKATPSKAEFKGHGKRISRLEKAVFATP